MKCIICKKMLRTDNKYNICSNCQGRSLGSLIRDKIITLDSLNVQSTKKSEEQERYEDGIANHELDLERGK